MCRSSSFPLQASATRPVSRTRCPMTGSDLRFARDPVRRHVIMRTHALRPSVLAMASGARPTDEDYTTAARSTALTGTSRLMLTERFAGS